jgi:hypothetical protein
VDGFDEELALARTLVDRARRSNDPERRNDAS